VRDPDVSGNRLVAVLDGKPTLQKALPFDMGQIDYGSILDLVDPATGIETKSADSHRLYRHPRLAPALSGIAAAGCPFSVLAQPGLPPCADTTVVRLDDIWILEE
jgi:hypothetical protein